MLFLSVILLISLFSCQSNDIDTIMDAGGRHLADGGGVGIKKVSYFSGDTFTLNKSGDISSGKPSYKVNYDKSKSKFPSVSDIVFFKSDMRVSYQLVSVFINSLQFSSTGDLLQFSVVIIYAKTTTKVDSNGYLTQDSKAYTTEDLYQNSNSY